MRSSLSSLAAGFLFAIGLGLSGMTQPSKVKGFLDILGSWDPSLIFVMIGAIAVHSIAYRFIRKKKTPAFGESWHVPTRRDLTPSLIIGSLLFGFGWALAGYCPGPALTALGTLKAEPFIFVLSMIFGILIFKKSDRMLTLHK